MTRTRRARSSAPKTRDALERTLARARLTAERHYQRLRGAMRETEQAALRPDLTNDAAAHEAWTAADLAAAERKAEKSAVRVAALENEIEGLGAAA